jgi:hypothetical protein
VGLHGVKAMAHTGSLQPFRTGLNNEFRQMADSNRLVAAALTLPSLPAGAMPQQRIQAGSSWEEQGPLNK